VAACEAIRGLVAIDWERLAAVAAADLLRGDLTKFQPCMPDDEVDRLLADRLLDWRGTMAFLAGLTRGVRPLPAPPQALPAPRQALKSTPGGN
jgi:hypothetical protein